MILPTMTEPSSPALVAIWRAGAWIALRTISTPCFWSSLAVFTRFARIDHREDAVVGCDKVVAARLHQNRPARGTHAGVHHHHVHRLSWKAAPGLRDDVSAFRDRK